MRRPQYRDALHIFVGEQLGRLSNSRMDLHSPLTMPRVLLRGLVLFSFLHQPPLLPLRPYRFKHATCVAQPPPVQVQTELDLGSYRLLNRDDQVLDEELDRWCEQETSSTSVSCVARPEVRCAQCISWTGGKGSIPHATDISDIRQVLESTSWIDVSCPSRGKVRVVSYVMLCDD